MMHLSSFVNSADIESFYHLSCSINHMHLELCLTQNKSRLHCPLVLGDTVVGVKRLVLIHVRVYYASALFMVGWVKKKF